MHQLATSYHLKLHKDLKLALLRISRDPQATVDGVDLPERPCDLNDVVCAILATFLGKPKLSKVPRVPWGQRHV